MIAMTAARIEPAWKRIAGSAAASSHVFRDTLRGELPPRYSEPWREPFDHELGRLLARGMRILDVGAGRAPTISLPNRPENCHYTGLDLSLTELQHAEPGSYQQVVVADVTELREELRSQFDLVVSWQVLEHVKPLELAIQNLRSYLRPGGHMLIQFSGTFSAFGLVNQVIPRKLGVKAMHYLLRRDPSTVFPAYYHHCYDSKLQQMSENWSEFAVVPRYRGGGYFSFLRPLQAAYMAYEELTVRWPVANAASHYMVIARR